MYKVKIDQRQFEITLKEKSITLDGAPYDCDISQLSESQYHVIKDNKSYNIEVVDTNFEDKTALLDINGKKHEVSVKDKLDALLEKLGMNNVGGSKVNEIKAPMPGLILSISVEEGTEVKKGDPLLILEAMKMENVIKAPGEGQVKKIRAKEGDSVEKNEVIIQF